MFASVEHTSFAEFKERFQKQHDEYIRDDVAVADRIYEHDDFITFKNITSLMEQVILCDNIDEFQQHVKSNEDQINFLSVNYGQYSQESALSLATMYHLVEKCEILLQHGALIELSDHMAMFNALFRPSQEHGSQEIKTITLLLDHGAIVQQDPFNYYIEDLPETEAHLNLFNLFIEKQPALVTDTITPLFLCVDHCKIEFLKSAMRKRNSIKEDTIKAFIYLAKQMHPDPAKLIRFFIQDCELNIFSNELFGKDLDRCPEYMRLPMLRTLNDIQLEYQDQLEELQNQIELEELQIIKEALADSKENHIADIVLTYVRCKKRKFMFE
jgi:hypothetical protein